jgi:hypothetical protein
MFKFSGRFDLSTSWFLIPLYCISCHIGDNVSFMFGGVYKHSVCLSVLFVYLLVLFLFVCIYLFFSVYKIFYFCLLLCC